jgi:hypothetical protein
VNQQELDTRLDAKVRDARRGFRKAVTDIPSVSSTEAYRINSAALQLEVELLTAAHEHWRDAIRLAFDR